MWHSRSAQNRLSGWWSAWLLAFLCCCGSVLAQVTPGRAVKGFKVAEQNPNAPRQTFLTGRDAVPLTKERYRITGLHLEIKENGRTVLMVDAPECLYDYSLRSAWSAGKLDVRSGDGRLALRGEGFQWQETNAVLVISNRVEASLHHDMMQGALNSHPSPPSVMDQAGAQLQVHSDQFNYHAAQHRLSFRGQVQVDDAAFQLLCVELWADLPAGGGAVEHIQAEKNVVIIGKQQDLQVLAGRAVLLQREGVLQLEEDVAWQMGERTGRGDLIRLDRGERRLCVLGNAFIRLPTGAGGAGHFLSWDEPSGKPSQNHAQTGIVEIEAGSLDLSERDALLSAGVRARRLSDRQESGQLFASVLDAAFGASNRLERMEARGHVEISEAHRKARAGVAVLEKDGVVRLDEDPVWQTSQMTGQARHLEFDPAQRRFLASPQVMVTIPFSAVGGASLGALRGASASAEAQSRTIQIQADRLEFADEDAVFSGRVTALEMTEGRPSTRMRMGNLRLRLASPGGTLQGLRAWERVSIEDASSGGAANQVWRLLCEEVEAGFLASSGALDTVTANGSVHWQDGATKLSAGRAVFTSADGLVHLTDHPVITNPQAHILDADEVTWDRAKGRYKATGPWRMQWVPDQGAGGLRDGQNTQSGGTSGP